MAIESDIARYIADNTSYTLGDSIWLHNVPEGEAEGIAVKFIRELSNYGSFKTSSIAIFTVFKTWATQRSNLETLTSLLESRRGVLNSSWGIASEVTQNNYGLDEYDRYISSVVTTVKHE